MPGNSFLSLIFYVYILAAALLLANAVPIPATTLPEGSGEPTTEATATTIIPNAMVPEFQCQADVDNAQSTSSLFIGLTRVYYYFSTPRTPVCPVATGARDSIRKRMNVNQDAELPFHIATSVLQAYSGIALLATQSEAVSEDDKQEMQVAHELLNGLIQNYFEVISRNHCSCPESNEADCIQLRDVSQEIDLSSYPSCSPADYFLDTISGDLQWIYTQYSTSFEFRRVTTSLQFEPVTCTNWKDQYLSSGSSAYSELTC